MGSGKGRLHAVEQQVPLVLSDLLPDIKGGKIPEIPLPAYPVGPHPVGAHHHGDGNDLFPVNAVYINPSVILPRMESVRVNHVSYLTGRSVKTPIGYHLPVRPKPRAVGKNLQSRVSPGAPHNGKGVCKRLRRKLIFLFSLLHGKTDRLFGSRPHQKFLQRILPVSPAPDTVIQSPHPGRLHKGTFRKLRGFKKTKGFLLVLPHQPGKFLQGFDLPSLRIHRAHMETVGNPKLPSAAHNLKLPHNVLVGIGGVHLVNHSAVPAHKIVAEQAHPVIGGVNKPLGLLPPLTHNAELVPHCVVKNHRHLYLCRRKGNLNLIIIQDSLRKTVNSFPHSSVSPTFTPVFYHKKTGFALEKLFFTKNLSNPLFSFCLCLL